MKTKLHFLPVILFASLFIYSCGASDQQAQNKESGSPTFQNETSNNAKADAPPPPPEDGSANANLEASEKKLDESGKSIDDVLKSSPSSAGLQRIISSSAARQSKLDSTHKFIRTADLKFRVKNVANATYRIEDLTSKFEGYVADTKLTSQLNSLTETPVTKDSSLETMRFTVMNTITLRVPSENLDTTLKSLVQFIDYLDYRNINIRDITLDILSNTLSQNRLGKYNARLSNDIDKGGQKLHDVQSAEQSMLSAQAGADNALIANLKQEDAVRYSTITLYIYQRETIRQELVKREKSIDAYEPGLGAKMKESLSAGWHGFQNFLMVVVILWPLWLIALATYVFLKWWLKRNKKINN